MHRRKNKIQSLSFSRSGEITILREIIYGILGAFLLLLIYSISTNYASFLFGGGSTQLAEDNLRSLALTVQELSNTPEPYTVIPQYPYSLGSGKITLIGFDAGDSGVTTTGIGCLTPRRKPRTCASKACICLFDSTYNPTPGPQEEDHIKGLIQCKKIDGVATISSIHEEHLEGALPGGQGGIGIKGINLGDLRTKKPLLANLPLNLQATDHLYLQRGFYQACERPKTGIIIGEPAESVLSFYENQPLYLERVIINGKGHLTIAVANEATTQRMQTLKPRIGITPSTITAKVSRADFTGAIQDSNAWLHAHDPNEPAYGQVLYIQGQAFEAISKLSPETATLLLETLGVRPPLPDHSNKHAGYLALQSYKAALEQASALTPPTPSPQEQHSNQPNQELQESITLAGLSLSERLTGYLPEVTSTFLPYFNQRATQLPSTTRISTYLAARQAAVSTNPNAEKLLTSYISSYPDSEEAKEARFLLARTYEDHNKQREALLTYQDIVSRYPNPEHTMPDGTTHNAASEIDRVCNKHLATEEVYDICSSIHPTLSCPQIDLVLLPNEACSPRLVSEHRCTASPRLAQALSQAQTLAMTNGKIIEVVSAYRTVSQQSQLYDLFIQGKGAPAARPSCIAPHVTGGAIDVRFKGEPMGQEPIADMSNPNRKLLETIMCQAGFTRWKDEYWHYEIGTKRAQTTPANYPLTCNAP